MHSIHPDGQIGKIGSNLGPTLYHHIHTKEIRTYWKNKGHFDQHTQQYVDWTTMARSSNLLSLPRQKWLSKWITGICGVGSKLIQWKWQPHSNCPRCLSPNETVKHVLQCNQDEAQELWNKQITSLLKWMREEKGQPDMSKAICSSLQAWRDDRQIPFD